MTGGRFVKSLFAALISGVVGWVALAGLGALRVLQKFEQFTTDPRYDDSVPDLLALFDATARTMQGGSAVFLGAAVSGVVLSEVVGSRSLLYHVGLAGGLSVLFATTLNPAGRAIFGDAATAIAIAGFIGGAVYWLLAGRSGQSSAEEHHRDQRKRWQ